MPEKVVVTGMNIISSLGLDLQTNWNNLVAGKSGVKKISLFDASRNITRIAAEVPSEFEEFSRKYIKKRAGSQMTRVLPVLKKLWKKAGSISNRWIKPVVPSFSGW